MPEIDDIVPTLFVGDITRSVEWYERVLGFTTTFRYEGYVGLELGPAHLHLAQLESAVRFKGACHLRLRSGVDEFVAAIEQRGQHLVASLKDHDYGMREATLRDPDGNDIYVGQPLRQPSERPLTVSETFFSISVRDMQRATAFYVEALGATVAFGSPTWSSLRIAGVRLGLALDSEQASSRVGLHFAVSDLAGACANVEGAGGRIVAAEVEVAPRVIVAEVSDTEGNTFTLNQGSG